MNKDFIDFSKAYFDRKTILITGSSGLIGSNFVKFFNILKQKSDIKLFLLSKTGIFSENLIGNSHIIVGDLTQEIFISNLPKVDFIFHTATYGQPDKFTKLPFETVLLNSQVLLRLLDLLKPKGRLLFCSSSEVYSGLENPPFSEDQIGTTGPLHPRSSYIESKKIGESIIVNFNRGETEARAVAVRISLAYGPGYKSGDSRVLNSIIDSALIKGKIELKDSGLAKRTYCYITDVIELCIYVLINGKDHIYNIGGIQKTTIQDLAHLVSKLTNSSLQIPRISNQFQIGAPSDVSLDMTKTLKLTMKREFVDLNVGVLETIKWRKEILKS